MTPGYYFRLGWELGRLFARLRRREAPNAFAGYCADVETAETLAERIRHFPREVISRSGRRLGLAPCDHVVDDVPAGCPVPALGDQVACPKCVAGEPWHRPRA